MLKISGIKEEEQKLVQMLKDGDRHAFDLLYQRYWRFLLNKATGWLWPDRTAYAPDAVQDTLMRVWKKIDSFEQGSKLSTWMTSILFNCCMAYHRRNSRLVFYAPDSIRDFVHAKMRTSTTAIKVHSPKFILMAEELNQRLIEELQKLEPENRKLIILRYWSELGYGPISKLLSMNENTARVRVSRALNLLRKRFYGFGPMAVPN